MINKYFFLKYLTFYLQECNGLNTFVVLNGEKVQAKNQNYKTNWQLNEEILRTFTSFLLPLNLLSSNLMSQRRSCIIWL